MNTFKKISKYLDFKSIEIIFAFLNEQTISQKSKYEDVEMEEEEAEEEQE